MKKKLVLMTSALMTMGLLAGYANVQKDSTPIYAEPEATNVIIEDTNEYYSYPAVVVNLYNKTEKMTFYFSVNDYADSYTSTNHKLQPNKVYTLSEMRVNYSYAKIDETEYPYKSASLELLSDANGFIGYLASVTLEDDTVYNIVEAEPMSGEMVIDEYKVDYGSRITLNDTETGSKFYFVISNIEDGVTYALSDFTDGFKYCYIGGDRYWNYRDATFKRTTDAKGLIHVEATVLTEHGDNLSLKYNEPEPIAVTGVSLNKSSTTIKYGGNETLIATVSPEDAADKSVTWSSNNESVATVDEAGKVTAVSVGNAVITVTTKDGEFKATCAVAVSESAVSVTNKINALPTPENVTLDDKDAIEAARKAYDSLDADEKALVTTETLKKLTDDENALASLKPATPEKQGLPAGAVVGIVIGSIFGVLLIACLVLFLLNKKGIINLPFLNKKK